MATDRDATVFEDCVGRTFGNKQSAELATSLRLEMQLSGLNDVSSRERFTVVRADRNLARYHALRVIAETPAIANWLLKNDPKALEQVNRAIRGAK